jgi:uncharacterized radical SAM superfamily protein
MARAIMRGQQMAEYTKEQIERIVQNMGLTVESVFVPFSGSRNKAEKSPSLNWRVTVKRDGREVLTTDYSAGCAHAPSYKQTYGKRTIEDRERELRVDWECENGFPAIRIVWEGRTHRILGMQGDKHRIQPKALDVLHSLAMESDVLDAGGFESWASELGFDTDSRKAEQTYRACLDIALKLRAALGDSGLQDLRNAFQGY